MSTHHHPTATSARDPSLEADLKLLIDAVGEAGDLAMTFYGNAPRTQTKPDGTQVSEADFAVDALLKERLISGRDAYGWLSEESEDNRDRLGKSRVWVVDPIALF